MARKKGVTDFPWSEPEFLIGTMDRRSDWTTIICLVGGGQEINKGEAGIPEWFKALKKSYAHWDVYTAQNLDNTEYLQDHSWKERYLQELTNERRNQHEEATSLDPDGLSVDGARRYCLC